MDTVSKEESGDFCLFQTKMKTLINRNYVLTQIVLIVFAFFCYFSCYAYRKPFSAEKYAGLEMWGVSFKIMLVTFQVIGYAMSKFIGIVFINMINMHHRGFWIAGLILVAEGLLILFGACPNPYNVIFMFLSALPLGVMWGLVYSYLEGRKISEFLGAGLCISFIVSSGMVKTVGVSMLNYGVPRFWMPATVGAIFYPVLIVCVLGLECCPEPTPEDVAARTVRVQLNGRERLEFIKQFGPGLFCMVLYFMLLTAYRDFRDNFATELWEEIGYSDAPSIFTTAELIVAVVVVVPIGLLMFVKDHLKALMGYHIMMLVSSAVMLVVALVHKYSNMDGTLFMIISGIGCYVPYVPFNSIIFDRMIAAFNTKANVGFVTFIADFSGYVCSIIVMMIKNFADISASWIGFYEYASIAIAIVGFVFMTVSGVYYYFKYQNYRNSLVDREEEKVFSANSESSGNAVDV